MLRGQLIAETIQVFNETPTADGEYGYRFGQAVLRYSKSSSDSAGRPQVHLISLEAKTQVFSTFNAAKLTPVKFF